MTRILGEGAVIAGVGIVTGALLGLVLVWVAGRFVTNLDLPGALPIAAAALILVGAALFASLMPATRASRVDVSETLRDA
jgi:ABC-type antimicrobial peptide transport system permease subunit